MNNLIRLNAILRLHNSNWLNLHWNSKGEEFNDAHKSISTDYYELADKYVDTTAEMIARLGGNAFNFVEVAALASRNKYYVVDSKQLYNRKDIIDASQKMLEEICNAIYACLEDEVIANDVKNAGIKSTLEAMLEDFDIQLRYINTRRLTN